MKNSIIVLATFLLIMDLMCCQHLEALLLGKAIKIASRIKPKKHDKKFKLYGVGAAKKAKKGTVAGITGKPLKLIGIVLGPLGIPLKIVGGGLQKIAVLEKTGAGILTVKKLSRDSVRFG